MRATNTVFEGGAIDLTDGYFENCTFKQCTLLAEGGGWTFTGKTQFLGPIQMSFGANLAARAEFAEYTKTSLQAGVVFIDEPPGI